MNGIKLEPGMLYIGKPGDDELVPLGNIDGSALVQAYEDYDGVKIQELITTAQEEATFTIKMTKQQIDNLMVEVYGFRTMAFDQMRESGHGRIVHLATRARKCKTRKKNLHRAYSALRIP